MAQIDADLALLQSVNVNYVRGAHYPQDQRFLDRCDEVTEMHAFCRQRHDKCSHADSNNSINESLIDDMTMCMRRAAID